MSDFCVDVDRTRVRCGRRAEALGVEFFLLSEDGGRRLVAEPVAWREGPPPGVRLGSPAFFLNDTHAQELMDQLWTCGLRPTEGKGSAGSLAATERHLEDMRAIAFNKLGVEKPKEPRG